MTDLEALQGDFAVAYYRFAVEEWRVEVANDYGRLRRFKSPFASRALATFDGLGGSDRADLIDGLLQRGHPVALAKLGIDLTPRQVELLQWRDAQPFTHDLSDIAAPLIAPSLRKKQVAKETRAKLQPLGKAEPMGSRLTWRYRTPYREFTILTYVDVGGRTWDLSYHHDVLLGDLRVQRLVSFLSWLGIGASKWTLQTEEDVIQAAELLAELCSCFLAALPRLFPA